MKLNTHLNNYIFATDTMFCSGLYLLKVVCNISDTSVEMYTLICNIEFVMVMELKNKIHFLLIVFGLV